MEQSILINQKVKRIFPKSDYTYGRIGFIVEVGETRVRVRWLYEANGKPITTCGAKPGNGVRTWVSYKSIQAIND